MVKQLQLVLANNLAIVLDGKIISAPVIRDTIASGSGQISGGFTFQSATDLALLLKIRSITSSFKYY